MKTNLTTIKGISKQLRFCWQQLFGQLRNITISLKSIRPDKTEIKIIAEKMLDKCLHPGSNLQLALHCDHCCNALRRISCHGRNHSQTSCEYSLPIFLCCQHHSEYSLFGSKFSTNLLFAASKCHVIIQRRCSSRCSKWPNRMGSLQW